MKTKNIVSPLDSRYAKELEPVSDIFSDENIIMTQMSIERAWILYLTRHTAMQITEFNGALLPLENDMVFNDVSRIVAFNIYDPAVSVDEIKKMELDTHHDVVAMFEYFKKILISAGVSKEATEFVHFGLTSQDIVTTGYNTVVKEYLTTRFLMVIDTLTDCLNNNKFDKIFLGRTHGQPAIPTSFKKEFQSYINRIDIHVKDIAHTIKNMSTKFGGAINNFAAAKFCNPEVNWELVLDTFVDEFLDLKRSKYGTQTDNYESLCKIMDSLAAICDIIIDLSRDIWTYCSFDYFDLEYPDNHVGSSTMAQKINPIDFEKTEGNAEIANMWFKFLSSKLRKSRLQRDLSDSTVMRNIGVVFGHLDFSIQSLINGLNKISIDESVVKKELDNNYQILAEAVQSKLKYTGTRDAFDKIKHLFKGKSLDMDGYKHIIDSLEINKEIKNELRDLKPELYYY